MKYALHKDICRLQLNHRSWRRRPIEALSPYLLYRFDQKRTSTDLQLGSVSEWAVALGIQREVRRLHSLIATIVLINFCCHDACVFYPGYHELCNSTVTLGTKRELNRKLFHTEVYMKLKCLLHVYFFTRGILARYRVWELVFGLRARSIKNVLNTSKE